MRQPHIAAPHCPLHVGAAMELVRMPGPRWIHLSADDPKEMARARARRAWRCPIAGCGRVRPEVPDDLQAARLTRKFCPRCHKESDGSGRLHGNNMCRSCRREYLKEYKAGLKWRAAKQARVAA